MLTLYHYRSSMAAQRVRLALAYKGVAHRCIASSALDDVTFFELGIAHTPVVLALPDGTLLTDSDSMLPRLDAYAGGKPLFSAALDADGWQKLLEWRRLAEPLLSRLCAPALPTFADIGRSDAALASYRGGVVRRFGMTLEELSNDRYAAFAQLSKEMQLAHMARHLATLRFYVAGRFSAADVVIACDLFPLQLLDGVSVPLDLMYHFERVTELCGASPRDGLCAPV
ncbi:MAG: glutathione S-transferase family protein [Burkholderiales bacterium]